MQTSIELHGKPCKIRLTKAAERALVDLSSPMLIEMEITLACMVKKQVHFRENQKTSDAVAVTDRLWVCVTSGEHCSAPPSGKERAGRALPPITNWAALIPKWLNIDYRSGRWSGDFGYTNPQNPVPL